MTATLFDNDPTDLDGPTPAPPTGWVLWHRKGSRGSHWEPIFRGESESACVGAIGGRPAGMWLILPAGREP